MHRSLQCIEILEHGTIGPPQYEAAVARSDMYQIHRQDILDWAREYQGEKFHAMLTDAPYHLTSITKRFGKEGSAPAKGDVYARASKGFMGQQWDGGGISFDPETWAALAEHLYPGAFGMTFASPRTHHRIACAIEDAGMIIQPTFYCWVYLSGFPKATRVKGYGSPTFKGHRYGGQAIKPSVEPVILWQKPYEGRPVDSIVATGAGALNIEQARIPTNGETWAGNAENAHNNYSADIYGKFASQYAKPSNPAGRWPSNFLLQHHPEDNGECHPDCPVRLFDEQAGESSGGEKLPGQTRGDIENQPVGFKGLGNNVNYYPADSGPASRMFYQADWQYEVAEQLANAEPVRYEPKVSSNERDAGLDDLETRTRHRVNAGGLENEPRFAPTQVKNNHPTLKPISLTKYLATLLLPPAAYAPRRILVPFAGVASEMIGCVLAGWESVTGIESNAAYVEIARARLAWWSQWPGWGQTDVDAIIAAAKEKDDRQLSLFGEAA